MQTVILFFWLILVVAGSMIIGAAGLLFVRRVLKLRGIIEWNDVAGFIYAVVGVIYAVILAFVVIVVWEQYSMVGSAVSTEAAVLVQAYRDTQILPEPQRQRAQAALRTYADQVTSREWATHGELLPHTTPDLLNPIWDIYRQYQPSDELQREILVSAEDRLHDLELRRHLRHLSEEDSMPPLFWPVLFGGGLVTVAFTYFFQLNSLRAHLIMTALLSGLIGGILFLVFSLNQPFTGVAPVSKQPFEHAMLQFHAIDLEATPTSMAPASEP
ncbi:MAG TPA: DUF4239 domain-containing protein [Thermomicrobiaceae bacterium]|nr:DUF4239 domain-containing protein [Thermomicrobiaceae bacterium]